MRLGPRAVESRRCARRGRPTAGWAAALLAVLGLLAAPTLNAQGTPAGTQVRNWAMLAFDAGGQAYGVASDTVDLLVGQVAGVNLQPPRVSIGAAGAAVVFAHTLTNLGNGPDSFTVTAVSVRGWPVTLYRDWDGDGLLGPNDSLLTGPVPLAPGSAASLLARVAIPAAASPGVSDTITVTATSRFSPAVSSSVQDRLDVSSAPVAVSLTKLVDRPTAVAADVLTYTLDYAVSGSAVASAVQLADSIPAGTSYVPGTMRWNGAPLTDAGGDDAGFIAPAGNGVVVVDFGTLAPGAAGSVTFQVQVNPEPARTVNNRSNVTFNSGGGSDTTLSNTVQTNVLVPALSLSKQLTSPSVALVGQQVKYTLRYGNAAGRGGPGADLVPWHARGGGQRCDRPGRGGVAHGARHGAGPQPGVPAGTGHRSPDGGRGTAGSRRAAQRGARARLHGRRARGRRGRGDSVHAHRPEPRHPDGHEHADHGPAAGRGAIRARQRDRRRLECRGRRPADPVHRGGPRPRREPDAAIRRSAGLGAGLRGRGARHRVRAGVGRPGRLARGDRVGAGAPRVADGDARRDREGLGAEFGRDQPGEHRHLDRGRTGRDDGFHGEVLVYQPAPGSARVPRRSALGPRGVPRGG